MDTPTPETPLTPLPEGTVELQLNPEDYINTLTQQRNAAMDEITKMSAIIGALRREVMRLTKEKKDGQAE